MGLRTTPELAVSAPDCLATPLQSCTMHVWNRLISPSPLVFDALQLWISSLVLLKQCLKPQLLASHLSLALWVASHLLGTALGHLQFCSPPARPQFLKLSCSSAWGPGGQANTSNPLCLWSFYLTCPLPHYMFSPFFVGRCLSFRDYLECLLGKACLIAALLGWCCCGHVFTGSSYFSNSQGFSNHKVEHSVEYIITCSINFVFWGKDFSK